MQNNKHFLKTMWTLGFTARDYFWQNEFRPKVAFPLWVAHKKDQGREGLYNRKACNYTCHRKTPYRWIFKDHCNLLMPLLPFMGWNNWANWIHLSFILIPCYFQSRSSHPWHVGGLAYSGQTQNPGKHSGKVCRANDKKNKTDLDSNLLKPSCKSHPPRFSANHLLHKGLPHYSTCDRGVFVV